MKRYKMSLVCFLFFAADGCAQVKLQPAGDESGVIEKVPQFYKVENNISIPTWGQGMRQKIWYKNQMSIKEVKGFYSNTTNKKTTMTYPVHCYLFKYPLTGMIYEYRNFSDTAVSLQRFKNTDSVNLVTTGTGYEDEPAPEAKLFNEETFSDTLIDRINYKRMFLHIKDSTAKSYYFITYSRCDKKIDFLKSYNLNIPVSDKIGCPVVKEQAILSPQNRQLLFSREIGFLADSLTKEEEKVFDAWEKRAKEDAADK